MSGGTIFFLASLKNIFSPSRLGMPMHDVAFVWDIEKCDNKLNVPTFPSFWLHPCCGTDRIAELSLKTESNYMAPP